MNYTMMSFNLRYNTPNDGDNAWPNRIERVAEMIKEHNPILVGTQEGYFSMLTELEEQLEEYVWIGMGRFGGYEEHNAIFYKKNDLEVVDQGHFWLSETPDEAATRSWGSYFPRMCTWGTFRDQVSDNVFTVFNTHLDHYSQEARDNGVKVIWNYVSSHMSYAAPVIVMGDLNSAPTDQPIRYLQGQTGEEGPKGWLTNAYTAYGGTVGRTAHSFLGGTDGEPIDYIFVSPGVTILKTKVDRRLIRGAYPSDHYPIVALLEIS